MATLEERVSALEESLAGDFANPFRSVMLKVDELGRDEREHGQDLREVKARLGVMDARLGMIDTRLNALDEKIDSFRTDLNSLRADVNSKFDQVIALLTQGQTK